jgi:hypothetical protein
MNDVVELISTMRSGCNIYEWSCFAEFGGVPCKDLDAFAAITKTVRPDLGSWSLSETSAIISDNK